MKSKPALARYWTSGKYQMEGASGSCEGAAGWSMMAAAPENAAASSRSTAVWSRALPRATSFLCLA
eukprot:9295668-Lingulodinium_polyedra.AAC.1